jgi:hypothetical protein
MKKSRKRRFTKSERSGKITMSERSEAELAQLEKLDKVCAKAPPPRFRATEWKVLVTRSFLSLLKRAGVFCALVRYSGPKKGPVWFLEN